MKISNFKFSNPQLVKLNFEANENGKFDRETDFIDISISNNIHKENENEAVVELEIVIGENTTDSPFSISLVIGAQFRLDDTIEETTFDRLLQVNAPAVLLSYARPIVSSITTQAGMKPLNLPFLNFTK